MTRSDTEAGQPVVSSEVQGQLIKFERRRKLLTLVQDDTTGTGTQRQDDEELHIHKSNFIAQGAEQSNRYDRYRPFAPDDKKLTATHRINNPFHGWDNEDVERVAKNLAIWYGAEDWMDVFVRVGSVYTLVIGSKLTIRRLPSHSSSPRPDRGTTQPYLDLRQQKKKP